MKKFFLYCLLVIFTITVHAQSNENYIKTASFDSENAIPENLVLNSSVSNATFKASETITLNEGFYATANVTLEIVDEVQVIKKRKLLSIMMV